MKRLPTEGVSTLTPMSELAAMAEGKGFKSEDFSRMTAWCRNCEATITPGLGLFHKTTCEDDEGIWFHRMGGNLVTAIVDFVRQR